MAHPNPSELRTKSLKELRDIVMKEKARLRDLHFRLAGAQLKNIQELTETRRSIARVLTIIDEKERPGSKVS